MQQTSPSPRPSTTVAMRQHVFRIKAPDATEVLIVGDFNNWDATQNGTLAKSTDGWWSISLAIPTKPLHYLFMVDRTPALDPTATGSVFDTRVGMRVSMLPGGQK